MAVGAADEKPVGAVVLFGPPGAGKGTQAQEIVRRLGIPQISTGDMIRAYLRRDPSLGGSLGETMRRGELVADEWVNRLVEQRLREPDCRRGFVLDGYPRTPGQAHALQEMLDGNGMPIMAFNIHIGYNELIPRITGRRSCPRCGAIYNIYLHPPKEDVVCDRDKTPLQMREDDREEVIRERLLAYEKQTRPVLEYFRKKGQEIYELDGTLPPEELTDQLVKILSQE